MQTLLITGASGFIGKNISERFSGKYKLLTPTHSDLELLDDEQVRDYLIQNNVDIVIHSATKPGHRNAKDSLNVLNANTKMFFNLARNSKLYKKMLFLSSGAAYDMRFYKPKMKEEYFDTHVPVDEHGFSKYICAKYIEKAENIVELRIFGVFGKYEEYAIRFLSNAICKVLNGLPITCRQDRLFDYLYIDDLVPILDHFIRNDAKDKAYNITPTESIGLLTIAEKVLEVSRTDLPIKVAKKGFGDEYSGDNSRLRKEIPNLNLTPIDEAIKHLYDWYTTNQGLINKELLLIDK